MEAKLARASHRHRQLAIHHIERQRAAAIKLQPNSNITLPYHHIQSSSKEDKIAALRHRRMKAASVEDSNLIACDRPVRPVIDTNSNDMNPDQSEETEILNEQVNWRAAVSLEEVMVEKRPAKNRIDSFELVCPPISRVIALSDEPSTSDFPQEGIEEDEGWERIGIDGELELDHETEVEVPTTRSWVGVVLGLEEKPKGSEKFGI
ncbi:uncharacterized protein MELLADRAFT_76334 [Melampsora larici-populina 98AG31]|uniref:Uncharacterized protein n=1 Tax=Melampsora larici-populina (strain 98AG31 / pathotype 3-4-7) TaxID=747676 RepID=F4R490_MELLP|nr:uncharacterized protein MELLADRAFT_76334 [Melampsora larici-populina 98AG31]EGG12766.1 hypothetical protein MELLADRAFT_76334 [Melampsora larici-populina 98AG31]